MLTGDGRFVDDDTGRFSAAEDEGLARFGEADGTLAVGVCGAANPLEREAEVAKEDGLGGGDLGAGDAVLRGSHRRPVGRAEVFDEHAVVDEGEPRMVPRDVGGLDDDVAFGRPPDQEGATGLGRLLRLGCRPHAAVQLGSDLLRELLREGEGSLEAQPDGLSEGERGRSAGEEPVAVEQGAVGGVEVFEEEGGSAWRKRDATVDPRDAGLREWEVAVRGLTPEVEGVGVEAVHFVFPEPSVCPLDVCVADSFVAP